MYSADLFHVLSAPTEQRVEVKEYEGSNPFFTGCAVLPLTEDAQAFPPLNALQSITDEGPFCIKNYQQPADITVIVPQGVDDPILTEEERHIQFLGKSVYL